MDLIHKIESLRYDIENGIETDVIKISVRLIQIKDQALQLQQTGVSGQSEQLKAFDELFQFAWQLVQNDSDYSSLLKIRDSF